MIGMAEIIVLLIIAALGHAMALVWYIAAKNKWKMCERTIYDLPFKPEQIKRELKNSIHAPIHAVLLAMCRRRANGLRAAAASSSSPGIVA